MSYDIEMIGADGVVLRFKEKHSYAGGTYMVGGTDEARFNITYNYCKFYYDTIDPELGIRWIYGKTGTEVMPALCNAVQRLGIDRDDNYWNATPGNAGFALLALIAFCVEFPDGVFNGD